MKHEKTELFESMPVPKAVWTLAVPTILSSLVMVLYNLADTYFVGMLNDPLQNAAVTLAGPVLLAFNAINNLFGVGASSMMSRAMGVKDHDTVRRASAFGFWCAAFSGLMFSLLVGLLNGPLLRLLGAEGDTLAPTAEYLKWTALCGAVPSILNVVMAYLFRSEGATLHASIGTMSGCLLNIILDPICILGLKMGAAGAGFATFLSNCFACLYFLALIVLRRGKTLVCISPAAFRPNRRLVKGVLGVGIPASIQNLLNVTGMTVMTNAIAAYGAEAVAAMGIAQKTTMIPCYIAMGISQGVMPLIGYNYAARNARRMKEATVYTTKASQTVMLIMTLLYFVFARQIVGLFMDNEQIIAYGGAFMRGLCLAQPFLCMDFMAVGVFQACGMGKRALLFAFLRKIALEIPALLVLNRIFPMYGLAYAQLAAEVVLAAAAIFFLVKIFRDAQQMADRARMERAAMQQE
ncbi:MAG: MATE family efflux transporter [Clostridia bacterium]|nr:MATE family efflux transporter [Clostridia bacterium]